MTFFIGKRWKEALCLVFSAIAIGYCFGIGFRLATFVCPSHTDTVNLIVTHVDGE